MDVCWYCVYCIVLYCCIVLPRLVVCVYHIACVLILCVLYCCIVLSMLVVCVYHIVCVLILCVLYCIVLLYCIAYALKGEKYCICLGTAKIHIAHVWHIPTMLSTAPKPSHSTDPPLLLILLATPSIPSVHDFSRFPCTETGMCSSALTNSHIM